MIDCIIVGAGSGIRANLGKNKLLYKINNKEIILYTIDTFLKMDFNIILVVSKEDEEVMKQIVPKEVKVVIGGATRSESVYNGLLETKEEYCLIHDGARPLVTKDNILSLIDCLKLYDAVFLASEVFDSIKSRKEGIIKTLDREEYLLAETPQGFKTKKIFEAYKNSRGNYLDDISLYQSYYIDEQIGYVINKNLNFKMTYQRDVELFERILNSMDIKIGHSFDIHRLEENRKLMLGGIEIPYEKGLLGHSDADCLLHAISESILGALGLGDLGTFFPDDDIKYEGMDSKKILRTVKELLDNENYKIINIDSTIYAEAPKMMPYIIKMRECIADILDIDYQNINVKATTYEKLDSIGNGLAIAAEAVCLIKKN